VLVVAGSPELPGTAILSSTATLRAGAGKLQIATVGSIAPHVGVAVPEARVIALPETQAGGIDPSAAERLAELAAHCRAVLIGPGMADAEAIQALLRRLLPELRQTQTALVFDSEAMMGLTACLDDVHALETWAVLTPHAGETAGLLGISKEAVQENQVATAYRAAGHFRAVVAVKGATTVIADPDGGAWRNENGNVGLATSGSGDTLSGIIAGLLARGAKPAQAVSWAVYVHSAAGDRLSRRIGVLGFLARELLAEVPVLLAELAHPERA
jgi:hydroxyethylthiazole kinase-like uncharacterized protein yjeF